MAKLWYLILPTIMFLVSLLDLGQRFIAARISVISRKRILSRVMYGRIMATPVSSSSSYASLYHLVYVSAMS